MKYVKRDQEGNIIEYTSTATEAKQEALADDHPEIVTFENRNKNQPDLFKRLVDAVDAALGGDRTALTEFKAELER